jgi:asparagine synthase (glutamine-hydrolysing)
MSIWTGIQKLCPSELLYVRANGSMERSRYWSIPNGPSEMPREQDWCELVRETLRDSVRLRMVADVPLGIFLSGGIDSAVITALAMQEAGRTGGVRTFTAGFEDPQYDERDDARRVAEFLGTDHCQQIVQPSPKTMLDWVVDHYDEPFGDSSAIPTFLVCRAAREHVTVALGGDGGDEVFGGYDRYRAMHWAQTMNPAEYALVRLTGGMAGCFPGGHERSARTRLARFARGLGRPPAVQYFLYRRLFGPDDLLRLLCPDFLGEDYFVDTPADWFSELYAEGAFRDEALNAQRHDLQTYLPDDLLVKTDIASMAVSLEWRAPMLDHRVVELGLQLPIKHKLDRRTGKKILHRAFADLLPESVWQCRKRGFGVPLADWLRGPMREEMVSTLRHSVVREAGILQDEALVGLMNDHLSGKRDYSHRLWALMVFCRWLVRHCS